MFAQQIDVPKLVVLGNGYLGTSRRELERLQRTKRLVLRSKVEIEDVGDVVLTVSKVENRETSAWTTCSGKLEGRGLTPSNSGSATTDDRRVPYLQALPACRDKLCRWKLRNEHQGIGGERSLDRLLDRRIGLRWQCVSKVALYSIGVTRSAYSNRDAQDSRRSLG